MKKTTIFWLLLILFLPLTNSVLAQAKQFPDEKKESSAPDKFICEKCSNWVSATAKACPHCGSEFADFQCYKCRKMIPSDSKKCPHCGTNFEKEKKSSKKKGSGNEEKGALNKGAVDPSSEFSDRDRSWVDRFHFDGYFRISARTDFGEGSNTLGFWTLYGRLMNETNWFTFGFSYDFLETESKDDPRIRVYARIEGDSLRTGDEGDGNLNNFAFTQFYLETVNIPYKNLVTQTGTLWYNMGYIGIYDMYIGQTFWETVGFRIGQRFQDTEWFIGVGDSGYNFLDARQDTFRKAEYNTIPTIGGLYKFKKGGVWLGASLMVRYELGEEGNRNSPHQTQNVSYQDVLQGDVLEEYLDDNPLDPDGNFFPGAEPVNDFSFRSTLWMGFGNKNIGPLKLRWNDLSLSFENKPADIARTFTEGTVTKDVFVSEFTDERYEVTIADESYWILVPGKLDMVLGALVGYAWDEDNEFKPDDHNRMIGSVVMRPQYYLTDYFHYLTEVSFAVEKSLEGNRYREHFNSIGTNTNGVPDPEGLEFGDTDVKYTFQFKTGVVFNPNGKGIYNRPSIRLLFGVQYSNVHAAFSNSFNESLDQSNQFNKREDLHWHYMLSIEVEHWF